MQFFYFFIIFVLTFIISDQSFSNDIYDSDFFEVDVITFDANETNSIWVYGLDDDDVFEVKGKGDHPIFLRIIGGQNNDTYKISNGRKVKIYDQKSKKNTIEEKGGATFKFTDNYDYNTYDYKKQKQSISLFLPTIGYNPDDGVKIGPSYVLTFNGFQRNPFSQQHRISAGYYFATNSFDINYSRY